MSLSALLAARMVPGTQLTGLVSEPVEKAYLNDAAGLVKAVACLSSSAGTEGGTRCSTDGARYEF